MRAGYLWMTFAVLLALGLGMVTVAQAQTANVTSTVSWTPPTADSNGIPLNSPGDPNVITGYNLYQSNTPLAATPATATTTAGAGATSATITTTAATIGSTLYFYVTACDATGCSPLSAAASKSVVAPAAAPASPTSVTVTTTVTTVTTTNVTTAVKPSS